MPDTIPEAISKAEVEKKNAEREVDDLSRQVKRFLSALEAKGGDEATMTAEQQARTDDLLAKRRKAQARISELDGKLEALREVQAEEDEYQRQASVTVTTGAVRGAGDYDHRPGQLTPTRATGGPQWVRAHDRRPATVGRSQRFADHPVVADYTSANSAREQAVIGQHGDLGQMVRAMTTTSGSAIVPTVWAGDIIDRARNLSAVLRAGAEMVPMDAKQVQIGRLTGDPTAAFRSEGSTITPSDPTFDNVTLDAKTLSTLVVGSLEWFQDGTNVTEVVSNAIAQAIATQVDYVSLFGGVTAGGEGISLATPPNPRGILATLLAVASSSVLGSGANGTTQTAASFWREVQSTVFFPQTFNEMPNALLWNAKLAQQYVDAYDTTNQPLQMPANIGELSRFVTNQIPSFTQGTMTGRATDLFVGDFTQLLVGQRLDLTVQTLTERYAENGQIGIVAHWRGDVGLARPRAFAVYRYLQGAA